MPKTNWEMERDVNYGAACGCSPHVAKNRIKLPAPTADGRLGDMGGRRSFGPVSRPNRRALPRHGEDVAPHLPP